MTEYVPVVWDIETTGLNPLQQYWWSDADQNAQVTAVAWGVLDCDWKHGEIEHDTHSICDKSEYELLGAVRTAFEDLENSMMMDGDKEPFLIGWNARNFDHPYIGARYARLRQNGYPTAYGWKRLDMMRAVKKETGTYYSEDDYANEVDIETEPVGEGSDMPDLFKNGQLQEIRNHVIADIKMAAEIFVKRREIMMKEFYDHYDIDKTASWADREEL